MNWLEFSGQRSKVTVTSYVSGMSSMWTGMSLFGGGIQPQDGYSSSFMIDFSPVPPNPLVFTLLYELVSHPFYFSSSLHLLLSKVTTTGPPNLRPSPTWCSLTWWIRCCLMKTTSGTFPENAPPRWARWTGRTARSPRRKTMTTGHRSSMDCPVSKRQSVMLNYRISSLLSLSFGCDIRHYVRSLSVSLGRHKDCPQFDVFEDTFRTL